MARKTVLIAATLVVAAYAANAAATPFGTQTATDNRVTITVRPTIQDGRPQQAVRVAGTISDAKEGEEITIQAKDCGQPFFRAVAATRSEKDGTWALPFGSPVSTVLRADWRDATSAQVALRVRADIRLQPDLPGRHALEVIVVAKSQFWRKKALIQQRDPRLGRWRTVKTVVLADTNAAPGSVFVWSSAKFTLKVPRGTTLRAVFPATQARPCYLGGISNSLRR